ncbi:MAG: D-aminoacylase, partial [Flavobacteriaceae bacterium]
MNRLLLLLSLVFVASCSQPQSFDFVISNATIIDGSGEQRYTGMVGVNADTIAYVGAPISYTATDEMNAEGKVLSPGFINMLSWAYDALLEDGRSLSDLKQGVTLEVFGEGRSPGPSGAPGEDDYQSFGDAMMALEQNGVSTNVASYLGATTVRVQTVGYENRKATAEEYAAMKEIDETSMQE